jgi:energy-coupling factor transporter transmembrane protein EcfT
MTRMGQITSTWSVEGGAYGYEMAMAMAMRGYTPRPGRGFFYAI